jgi:amino acid adenylation domain-containing protein
MKSADEFRLEFGDQDFKGGLPQRFERVVERFGPRIAIIDDLNQMTYAELNAAANQLAHWLLIHCNQVNTPIALFFGHNLFAVVAVLGVLKAGKIYCALDVSSPLERNLAILEDLECQIILTDATNFAQAEALTNDARQAVDLSTARDTLSTNPQVEIHPQSLAAIYYTSGSTGTPKGVVRTHWYYLKRTQLQVDYLETVATDTLSMLNSLCFGSSASDLYAAILSGAALCFYNTKQVGVEGLTEWIQKCQVTQLHLPNTSLRPWLDTVPEDLVFHSINVVRPSFRLYWEDIHRLWQHLPDHATIMHALIATETGPVCRIKLHRHTSLEGKVVPVGYTVPGVEILLLDDEQVVPPGEVGEIYVSSPYTHRYWRRPELDEEKFINDPLGSGRRFYRLGDLGRIRPDGMLELVGRKDFQVKIRGYRVEIEEVEIALERLESVRQAAVVARSDALGEKQLIAYVAPVASAQVIVEKLRADLRTLLPDYAIPARFLLMDHLPLVNGKVDRKALPAPGNERPDLSIPYVAPRMPFEEQLCAIWADVLGLDAVGVDDNFLDLGGHSLAATQIVNRVQQTFGVTISLQAILSASTVAEMALAVLGILLSENEAQALVSLSDADVSEITN